MEISSGVALPIPDQIHMAACSRVICFDLKSGHHMHLIVDYPVDVENPWKIDLSRLSH
jgi:hypothetical protein